MTTRFCIVRHGETAWNAEMRVQGQLDIPLNDVGRWQATQVAVALSAIQFDAVVSSDLLRAKETARLAASNNSVGAPRSGHPAMQTTSAPTGEIEYTPALRERHYGKFQGLKYVEAQQQFPEDFAAHKHRHADFAYGNGESLTDFAARVMAVMAKLLNDYQGKTLLVVSHGGVLDVVHRMANRMDLRAPRDFPIPNAAINWLRHDESGWSIDEWAGSAHLERARDELTV
jgi:probable phosphoglycerate mutase